MRNISEKGVVFRLNDKDDPKKLLPGECTMLWGVMPSTNPTPYRGTANVCEWSDSKSAQWVFWGTPEVLNFGTQSMVYFQLRSLVGSRNNKKIHYIDLDSGDKRDLFDYVALTSGKFSFVPINDAMYLIPYKLGSCASNAGTVAQFVDGGGDLSKALPMVFDPVAVAPACSAVDSVTEILHKSKWVTYAFTWVRLFDEKIFAGFHIDQDTFSVPRIIGLPDASKCTTVQMNSSTNFGKFTVTIPNKETCTAMIEKGATHLRVWRTDESDTQVIAEGLSLRFLKDLALVNLTGTGSNSFSDVTTQATLLGELSALSFAYSTVPEGACAKFINGRLWIGCGLIRGRWYYSEVAGGDGVQFGAQYPEAYSSLFNPQTMFVDFKAGDNQEDAGIAVFGRDLLFFKQRSIGALLSSDPTRSPVEISATLGAVDMDSIVSADIPGVGQCVLFLSQEGPAIVLPGMQVRLFEEFKAKALYPINGFPVTGGYRSVFFEQCWMIHGFGYRFGLSEDVQGTFGAQEGNLFPSKDRVYSLSSRNTQTQSLFTLTRNYADGTLTPDVSIKTRPIPLNPVVSEIGECVSVRVGVDMKSVDGVDISLLVENGFPLGTGAVDEVLLNRKIVGKGEVTVVIPPGKIGSSFGVSVRAVNLTADSEFSFRGASLEVIKRFDRGTVRGRYRTRQ